MNGGKSSKVDAKISILVLNDPNKPKRPATAFFVFMEDFIKQFKVDYPENKSVAAAAVGKAGGAKWKSMTDSEKAPYAARADKRKKEYEKALANYNKKQAADDDEDDSDKSVSDVNNETDEDDSDDNMMKNQSKKGEEVQQLRSLVNVVLERMVDHKEMCYEHTSQAQELMPLGVTKQVDQSMLLEKMVEKQFKEKTEMFESMLEQALGKERDARLATEEAAKIKRMRSNKEIEKLRNSLNTMQLNLAILFLLMVVFFVIGAF